MLDGPLPLSCPETPSAGAKRDAQRARLADALLRTANDDRDSFRIVYLLTRDKLFGICARICGERSAAEDVLADVYLTIWKRAGAWKPARGSAITWLSAIARNRALDWHRARAVRGNEVTDDLYDVPDECPNGEMRLLSAERTAQVQRCLRALKPEAESAIRSAFFDGLTYSELAAREGVPLGTMKSLMRRSFVRMRVQLECRDEDAWPDAATTIARPPLLPQRGVRATRGRS